MISTSTKSDTDHPLNKCMYCGHEFGIFEEKVIVREATKPPYSPNKFKNIGIARIIKLSKYCIKIIDSITDK